jgi:hypothetical protein
MLLTNGTHSMICKIEILSKEEEELIKQIKRNMVGGLKEPLKLY